MKFAVSGKTLYETDKIINIEPSYLVRKCSCGRERKLYVEYWKDFKHKSPRSSGTFNISGIEKIIQNKSGQNDVIWKNVVSTEWLSISFTSVSILHHAAVLIGLEQDLIHIKY